MFLSVSCFSEGIISDCLPNRQSYQYLEFNNSPNSLIMDSINILDYELSDSSILSISNIGTWNEHYLLKAEFENSLEAGSLITSIPYPLTKYIIRRKITGDSLNPILASLDYNADLQTYIDYTARNNFNYTYTVSPYFSDLTNRIEGRGLEGDGTVSFAGWILCDTASTPVTSYIFDMEIESDNINTILDMKKYDGYTQFSKVNFGNRQYKEGGLKTVPYRYVDGSAERTIDVTLLDQLEAFINNKQMKYLKSPSGEILSVVTFDFSYKYYDKTFEQPFGIQFKFTQIQA